MYKSDVMYSNTMYSVQWHIIFTHPGGAFQYYIDCVFSFLKSQIKSLFKYTPYPQTIYILYIDKINPEMAVIFVYNILCELLSEILPQ